MIRGKIATLRVPTEADLADYNAWMADPLVRQGRAWHEPATLATWKERLLETAKDRRQVLWSISEKDRLVGLCVVRMSWEGNDVVELAHLVVEPAAQRRGIGGDAALALHRYLFDYLNVRATETALPADAVAALRIIERLGYTRYAHGTAVYYRDGAYTDELRFRFDRATWDERWGASEREYPPHAPEAVL